MSRGRQAGLYAVVEHEATIKMGHRLLERHREEGCHAINDEGQQDTRREHVCSA